ncbi:MAG TPA: hypothetical protein DCS07_18300 [Bdellovibrionales bacterium]|nr:MAG: hypothetical protein A2Z97_03050 [Bdellovibrionales bacterium GWB1_52_6]OFZ06359.1 MAG: hypothetical protein A2X97_02755 [Bdellovibrionales bacterium GWA1_52_35]OFZ43793.1 MAG: hypothetical protein A2070_08060 [Bdellovibrionales bacterium GWC1_52_8]HAR44555.1 hypothetical protein [Bdellovibrionales bacterium]HCM40112.1 hypothetical protein [Bdellovibrionales bacterium]
MTIDFFLHIYLTVWLLVLQIPLGGLGLLMIFHLTGGHWGQALRPALERTLRLLPILAILFIPLIIGANQLFPWVSTRHATHPVFLSLPIFALRALTYFGIWSGISYFLLRAPTQKLAAIGLLIHSFAVSFAAIDWIMTLEPHWYSSELGLVYLVSCGLSALAFAVLIPSTLNLQQHSAPGTSPLLGKSLGRDLGNLLLMLTLLWSYLAFSQYLIIWLGQLPEETSWFIRRTEGNWRTVAQAIVIISFAVPFMALLFRSVKDSPRLLKAVCIIILLGRVFDQYWMIAP